MVKNITEYLIQLKNNEKPTKKNELYNQKMKRKCY